MKVHKNIFDRIIAPEHLFLSWDGFKKGKRNRTDVEEFEWRLEENICALHRDLRDRTYRHDSYSSFFICDPKQRHIHKATVRDRIVHHAAFSMLNPIFEPTFIAHSFSCREGKGTHKAVDALQGMLRQVSRNGMRHCYALQCDVYKFFDSLDHGILLKLLGQKIKDDDVMRLLAEIINSFSSPRFPAGSGKGVPIGNLTSQLFANIYLHELDHFMKHELRIKPYVRYTDDFAIVGEDTDSLQRIIPPVQTFLQEHLLLTLHPKKVKIRKYRQGIDFLGYVVFPHHRLVRTRTRQRMFRKLRLKAETYKRGQSPKESVDQSLLSYLGVLSHADTFRLSEDLKNRYWFWVS